MPLIVNGVPAGVREYSSGIALWLDMKFAAGNNRLEVTGKGRGIRAADSCTMTCSAQVIERLPRR